jgi:hypothetical protein
MSTKRSGYQIFELSVDFHFGLSVIFKSSSSRASNFPIGDNYFSERIIDESSNYLIRFSGLMNP